MPTWWNAFYEVVSLVLATGILGAIGLLLRKVIEISISVGQHKEKMITIDKELASHGSMLQQLTGLVNRLLGRNEERDIKRGD